MSATEQVERPSMSEEKEEKMELTHKPVPGYRTAFFIAITLGSLYLGFIFMKTL